MKKLFNLSLAVIGAIVLLAAPGIVAADQCNDPSCDPYWNLRSPVGFIPRADNTYYLPNTGGGAGPEWGPYVGVDSHGDASPYMRDPNGWTSGPLYSGMVLTWIGDSSTLPSGISFNHPFNFRPGDPTNPTGAPSTLHDLLSGSYGPRVNDLVTYLGGISSAWIISEPVKSLLPFETGTSPYPSPPYIEPWLQESLWKSLSDMYKQTQLVVIPADMTNVYTKYVAQDLNWPLWDPTVPDRDYYAGYEMIRDRVTGEMVPLEPRYHPDYPAPSTWTQYNFYIQNDIYTTPEPGTLLLLGFGLLGLAAVSIRRKR
jgi:hypothetical protein